MSSRGRDPDGVERAAFHRLESVVGDVLEELDAVRERARDAERRGRELAALLARFQSGEDSPEQMRARLQGLEAENGELRERFTRGRETVERLLARIRFLEQHR